MSKRRVVSNAVECGGKQHRICFDGNCLFFPDHENIKSEITMLLLGAEPCGCIVRLMMWRKRLLEPFHGDLYKALFETTKTRHERSLRRARTPAKRQQLPMSTVAELLDGLGTADCSLLADRLRTWPMIQRPMQQRSLRKPTSQFPHHPLEPLRMSKRWRDQIYDKGLALIDDKLVLDVFRPIYAEHFAARRRLKPDFLTWWLVYGENPDPTRTYVLAVRRTTDFANIYSYPAEVVQGKIVWFEPKEST